MLYSSVIVDVCSEHPSEVTIVRRFDGSVNFHTPDWSDYRSGFGNDTGELWVGLDILHNLTSTCSYGLHVTMKDFSNHTFWSEYSHFSVGPESDNCRVRLSGYNAASTAGDGLATEDGMEFSTGDRDNDMWSAGACAVTTTGGWWYRNCSLSKPTGKYYWTPQTSDNGIIWTTVYNSSYVFKSMELIIKLQ